MKAAVAGSTGFIGSLLIQKLQDDSSFNSVVVLSRRSLDLHKKFTVLVGDVSKQILPTIDVAFCALGTTIAKAGSKEAFYHVDHDLVIAFAEKAKQAGARTFVVVSSVGADVTSSNFYLKVKGETERDLSVIGFESLVILRPSMLMGERKEFRLGELVGKGLMTLVNPFMIGPLAKYKGVSGVLVANSMLNSARLTQVGTKIVENDQLTLLGQ